MNGWLTWTKPTNTRCQPLLPLMMVNDDQKFIIRHSSMQRSMQSKANIHPSMNPWFESCSAEKVNISFMEVCTKLESFAPSFIISEKGASHLHSARMGEIDWGAWTLNVYSKKILTQKSKYTRRERESVESMVVESHSKLLSSFVQVKLIINNQNNVHHSTIPVCSSELNEQRLRYVVEEKKY